MEFLLAVPHFYSLRNQRTDRNQSVSSSHLGNFGINVPSQMCKVIAMLTRSLSLSKAITNL